MARQTKNVSVPSRENCLDLFRGLCLLGIIFNHTCFISGTHYVPDRFAQFTMMLDIPALFFISGMTYQHIKRDMIVNSFFKFAMCFTLLSLIINFVNRSINISTVVSTLFLVDLPLPPFFKPAQDAYWFVPVYMATLICGTVILSKLRAFYGVCIIALLWPYFYNYYTGYYFLKGDAFGVSYQLLFFPISLFLIGFWAKDKIIGTKYQKWCAGAIFIAAIATYYSTYLIAGDFVFNFFFNKFPTRLPYVAASFVSVAGFMWFYRADLKNRFIERIGQYAIFYYAAQGIGSCLLNFITPHINLYWVLKLPLAFIINIVIITIIAEELRFIYEGIKPAGDKLLALMKRQKKAAL